MNLSDYDFFDFGCSAGANIGFIQQIAPELRGLGIDIDQKKIDQAIHNGYHAVNLDINNLPDQKLVKFVTMSHFLEHLPSTRVAETMLRKAMQVSDEFILIKQPWFDSDGALLSKGVKFFWSDWRGHPNKMTSLDFYLILKRAINDGLISGFAIMGRGEVKNTDDKCLIPLSAPIDQHHYDKDIHGLKPQSQSLPLLIFREVVVVISMSEDVDFSPFLKPLGHLIPLITEGGIAGRNF